MHALASRLSLPTAAFVAAGVVAVTPVVAPPAALSVAAPPVAVSAVPLPKIELTASVLDILQFPAFKQWVANQVIDVAILGAGWALAGQGLVDSILALPSTIGTALQQVLSRDLLGALTTIEVAVVDAVTAIGGPLLESIIERNQRTLAVQGAMQQAVPEALIGLGTSIFAAIDGVTRAFIVAGQDVVGALLPINLGNLVTAIVDGARLVVQSIGDGAGDIVDGIVFAQQTIATALATQPPPTFARQDVTGFAAAAVSEPPSGGGSVVTLSTSVSSSEPSEVSSAVDPDMESAKVTESEPESEPEDAPEADKKPENRADTRVDTKDGNKVEPTTTAGDAKDSSGDAPTTVDAATPASSSDDTDAADDAGDSAGDNAESSAPAA